MHNKRIQLFDTFVTAETKSEIIDHIQRYLTDKKTSSAPFLIVSVNPEQVVSAQKDREFKKILNMADIALPDGAGIIWANNILLSRTGVPISERIAGIDLMENLIKMAAEKQYVVGLLGGYNDAAVQVQAVLIKKFPQLHIWLKRLPQIYLDKKVINNEVSTQMRIENNPDADSYFADLAAEVKKHQTRLLFVALGAPKQEYFIEQLRMKLEVQSSKQKKNTSNIQLPASNSIVLMPVGGAFDMLSGKTPRAPQLLRSLGLEWLWRLVLEPWRIKRQFGLLVFVVMVFRKRLFDLE